MPATAAQHLAALRDQADEFIGIRHRIHANPELAFQEFGTSDLVAGKLQQWGYAVERGLGGTGVVGQLKRGHGAKRLGLRADMDALPIEEKTGLRYASGRPGIMHACGHDGHTATLLAAAHHLARHGEFSGTLNLIFQPAEESAGGALRMIEQGLFEKYPCEAVFAMHNGPGVPQGRFVFREGPMMASSDYATITLHGVGGHGAMPHQTADPIVAAASTVMALQTIVSRNADPMEMAIVTVGALHAGQANNVIPASAQLELSIRALTREMRALLERRIRALVAAQAVSFGVHAEVDYRRGYSVLVNTPEETAFAREVALDLVGPDHTELQGPALSASEDFSFMLEKVPGCYLVIGNGDGEGACHVHNPGYDFNDDNIAMGAAYWTCLAERFLVD
ncbi:M20 aminoacylase family protein [Variovorax sp. PBL-E5]|uniref:M20 aminoacylase family protein n=1 Tax=Variovorax sp. PBL-E5 TaxID=434014 RepID=UPI0013198F0B|nr:M20 aminoacylase family protein [Variovorax sp. PBL-E5]VTU25212.1 putative hydrolase YxeP [Variovorax sp. PBL-E5]